jgi:signal transduction histidine kinase
VSAFRSLGAGRAVYEAYVFVLVVGLTVGAVAVGGSAAGTVAASAVLASVVVLLRGRFPGTALVVAAAMSVWVDQDLAVEVCTAYAAGYRIGPRWRAAVPFGLAALARAVWWWLDGTSAIGGILALVSFAALVVLPGLLGRYSAQRRRLIDALAEQTERLRYQQTLIAEQARLLERARIARDVHDSVGNQLCVISVLAGGLEVDSALGPAQRESVRRLRTTAHGALQDLRVIVGMLDRPDEPGSLARIDELVRRSAATGMAVRVETSGPSTDLDAMSAQAAYRVVQEGLTNAHRHAPEADVAVTLRYEPDAFVVEVVNGAAGRPPARELTGGGSGLAGLAERVRLAGGVLHSGPTADRGFRTAAMLPYHGGDDPRAAPVPAQRADQRRAEPPRAEATGAPPAGMPATPVRSRTAALLAGLLVLVVGGVGIGASRVARGVQNVSISQEQYDRIPLGAEATDVERVLPSGDSVLTNDLKRVGGPTPPGSRCRYYLVDNTQSAPMTVYRFCFVDGRLVEKTTFAVVTTPWATCRRTE